MDEPQSIRTTEDFVKDLLLKAVDAGASDLHIEPHIDRVAVRYRIDGILQERIRLSLEDYAPVVNTIKVMAGMDITEHFVPQDGHIELFRTSGEIEKVSASGDTESGMTVEMIAKRRSENAVDVRLSIFPSVNGQVVVARLLNRSSALRGLGELDMDESILEQLRILLTRSSGIFLITGPTGSGKTTTLYSFLDELKSTEKNVMTIEDPVEFHVDWMRQGELNEARGFTYDAAMRSILRQDPDVLMIGEIRDVATAEYAIRSALIGRVVCSTVHANSVVGTVARLLDMGLDRSLIAYSINGIMAKRLVRAICPDCIVDDPNPNAFFAAQLGIDLAQVHVRKGAGCDSCFGSGYKGRIGVFSMLVFDDAVRSLIIQGVSMAELQVGAIQAGMRTLQDDVINKLKAGRTSLDEAMKVL
jgi:type II secretory ATPase GspE/PulE/Tfp pilus assembly ATPase PilB-like protein